MSFENMIDKQALKELQEEFCMVTGMYVCCLDSERQRISDIAGEELYMQQAIPYFAMPIIGEMLDRVKVGSLEEMAIESLNDGRGRIATIAIRSDREISVYWIVLELYAVEHIGSGCFEHALDLIRSASKILMRNRIDVFSAEEENRRSESARLKMERTMETIEVTTSVVQLLDDDSPLEEVIDKWLKMVCPFLGMDSAQVFNLHEDGKTMDVHSTWYKDSVRPFFIQTTNVASYSFLYTEKPIILTGKGLDEIYKSAAEESGVQAIMIFPLLKQNNGGMVLSLNHRKIHEFEMSEIKFVADVTKVLQSIIVKRLQKNSMISSYAALEAVLDHVKSAVCVVDKKQNTILFANDKLRERFERELMDRSFMRLINWAVETAGGKKAAEIEFPNSRCWFDFSFEEISWVDGRPVTMYTLYDITEKKLYQKRIEQQAQTDFLTGLYNRMCCEKDLEYHIQQAIQSGGTGAVLYLDLDDFKHINDSLGHQYGDVLLKAISHAFQRIPGVEHTCYRMGGDEFVIVIPHEVYHRLDKILAEMKDIFSKPWFLKNADYYCTMSMGIVTFPANGDTVLDLIKKADIAMYEAKKGGKNKVVRYNDNIGAASDRRLDMEKNMRDATTSLDGYREFVIYYQPIINVHNEEIECAGAEALIRWNNAHLGFISPAEFIPLAEYLGLINPIGNYVLREACRHCRQWNDNGYPDYKVNVNLSVVQLLQPDIVEIVEKTIKESGVNPRNLTLEVTESLAINDMERMKEILNGIKALGVKLALDDFGTGYSSLNHIREIPFDIIKVDQSFVKDLADNDYAKSFVKMVSELAEAIGVSVCVEGIETIHQYSVLHGMKVKYIQGYFFDRPMPRDEFEAKYVQQM